MFHKVTNSMDDGIPFYIDELIGIKWFLCELHFGKISLSMLIQESIININSSVTPILLKVGYRLHIYWYYNIYLATGYSLGTCHKLNTIKIFVNMTAACICQISIHLKIDTIENGIR